MRFTVKRVTEIWATENGQPVKFLLPFFRCPFYHLPSTQYVHVHFKLYAQNVHLQHVPRSNDKLKQRINNELADVNHAV